jgi:hypothetical protein
MRSEAGTQPPPPGRHISDCLEPISKSWPRPPEFGNLEKLAHALFPRTRADRDIVNGRHRNFARRKSWNLLERNIVPPDDAKRGIRQIESQCDRRSFGGRLCLQADSGPGAFADGTVHVLRIGGALAIRLAPVQPRSDLPILGAHAGGPVVGDESTRYSHPPCSAALLFPEMASEPGRLRYWDRSTNVRGAVSGRALQVVQPAGDPFEPGAKPN